MPDPTQARDAALSAMFANAAGDVAGAGRAIAYALLYVGDQLAERTSGGEQFSAEEQVLGQVPPVRATARLEEHAQIEGEINDAALTHYLSAGNISATEALGLDELAIASAAKERLAPLGEFGAKVIATTLSEVERALRERFRNV